MTSPAVSTQPRTKRGSATRVGAWKQIGDKEFITGNARWLDQACHRSLYSYQLRTALQLAVEDPSVALVWEALLTVASARDRAVFLEVLVQTSLGDRAAAATVGGLLGMKPEAVRQQVSRIRRRLRDLAALDPRFADLAGLAIVA